MSRLLIPVLIIFLYSCSGNVKSPVITVRKGDTIIKGNIINDTIFNDTIAFYGLNGELLSRKVYHDNRLEGSAIDYYSNGKPMSTTVYRDDLKNGYAKYFDSTGKLLYENYYYYNLIVGPILFYDSLENPKRYYFSNLQNETLFVIDYTKWNGINEIYSSCVTFITNRIVKGAVKEINLLLYLPQPPKFDFSFSVYKKNIMSESESFVEVKKIYSNEPFKFINLPILPDDENYAVGLKVYDSLLNKQTVIYKDF